VEVLGRVASKELKLVDARKCRSWVTARWSDGGAAISRWEGKGWSMECG